MENAKYTVAEIDALRGACESRYLFGTTAPTSGMSRSYYEPDKAKAVEEMVRTYMLAGIRADDLYAQDGVKLPSAPSPDQASDEKA